MSVFSIELVETGTEKEEEEEKKEKQKEKRLFPNEIWGVRGEKQVCVLLCIPAEGCGHAWEPPR